MDKFRAQSLRFGTKIITETVAKVDLSARPFRYWREFQEDQEPETADTLIIATGASAKRLGLKGEDTYWQSGISACAVCDGAVPIFRYVPSCGFLCYEEISRACFSGTSHWLSLVVVTLLPRKQPVRPSSTSHHSAQILTYFLNQRSDQVWLACVCPCPTWRAPRIENHGQASHEPPQSHHPLEHRRSRVPG
jgi:hypothetical protein